MLEWKKKLTKTLHKISEFSYKKLCMAIVYAYPILCLDLFCTCLVIILLFCETHIYFVVVGVAVERWWCNWLLFVPLTAYCFIWFRQLFPTFPTLKIFRIFFCSFFSTSYFSEYTLRFNIITFCDAE